MSDKAKGTIYMGRVPRCGSMADQDYLRPAAVAAGILSKEDILDSEGKVIGTIYKDKRGDVVTRFGWHNLRHSLSSFLVAEGTDPKTVQSLLRHANIKTTMDVYAHANSNNKMAAQDRMGAAIVAAKTKALESAETVSKAIQ